MTDAGFGATSAGRPLAIVAGAHGAIGREVARQLTISGWRVAGIGHGPADWAGERPIDRWRASDISLESLTDLTRDLGPVDAIFNLAVGSSVGASIGNPAEDFRRTVGASIQLLDFIRTRAPGARLIAVSSAAVYGAGHQKPIREEASVDPVSPYGHHKLQMERDVGFWGKTYDISSVIVRLFSVYGVGLRKQMIFDLCTRLAGAPDRLVVWGVGSETRDWVSIEDAARLLIELAPLASPGAPIYNGCTGEGRRVDDMARLLASTWGAGTEICFDGVAQPGNPQHLVGSPRRLRSVPFQPRVSLEQGLAAVVADAKRRLNPSGD
jgi:UDP-glucose 4-epimerase